MVSSVFVEPFRLHGVDPMPARTIRFARAEVLRGGLKLILKRKIAQSTLPQQGSWWRWKSAKNVRFSWCLWRPQDPSYKDGQEIRRPWCKRTCNLDFHDPSGLDDHDDLHGFVIGCLDLNEESCKMGTSLLGALCFVPVLKWFFSDVRLLGRLKVAGLWWKPKFFQGENWWIAIGTDQYVSIFLSND